MTERQISVAPTAPMTPRITVMSTPPNPIGFEDLWAEAFTNYTSQTGRDLQDQTTQFIDCHSVDDVVRILETRSKDLTTFRGKGKMIRALLAPVVRLIELVNDTAGEAAAATGVPGGKAVFAALAILLTAGKGVTRAYDILEDLSERIQDAVSRIDVHLQSNSLPSPGLKSIFIQMLVQVLQYSRALHDVP
ncbi:hypothetical protein BT96DRAFT_93836 [Gymnopus androsaceus JB14]|uniref:Fungal STAND N-terminal Goodbye domain-containing protein n=1 Tax=Gymnopus androsaceus JB14 TaxID=1447944 RepID=A0A6A4GCG5_9AGAR|nr:hypothetical protein BT96DRAFT_93836 [Gymnopus androsaceus JB14]